MNYIKAVQILVDAGVEFVITGGWSAILHGSSYGTEYLEICFARQPDNLKRLAGALAPFHPGLRDPQAELLFVWDEATLRNGTIFTLQTDLGFIDLLAEVSDLGGYIEIKASSIRMPAFDREVWTLDLPELIRSKRAAGRPKDLLMVPELESLLEARPDD